MRYVLEASTKQGGRIDVTYPISSPSGTRCVKKKRATTEGFRGRGVHRREPGFVDQDEIVFRKKMEVIGDFAKD